MDSLHSAHVHYIARFFYDIFQPTLLCFIALQNRCLPSYQQSFYLWYYFVFPLCIYVPIVSSRQLGPFDLMALLPYKVKWSMTLLTYIQYINGFTQFSDNALLLPQ